jgi:hypothetical protein
VAKKKLDTDDESLPYIIGSGSFAGFTPTPKTETPKVKTQIGFIRQKCKQTIKTKNPSRQR